MTIYLGDCLEILPKLEAKSVDLILCDLPYGTTQNVWDTVIDFDILWGEYERLLKPKGAVVLTSQGLFTARLILSKPDWFKYKIVWEKSKATNFLNAKKQPLRKHEDICVFYPRQPYYDPQMGIGEPYNKGVRKDQQTGSYGNFKPSLVKSSGKRYPTDVIYFKTAESEGEVYHPNQKPVDLMRYLIRTYSPSGGVVLDNCMGSGSTGLAAALEGRKFIGIEKETDYFNIAKKRLAAGRAALAQGGE